MAGGAKWVSAVQYGIADRFDEIKAEYVGLRLAQLVTIDLNSDVVLVRREVADAQLAKHVPQMDQLDPDNKDQVVKSPPPTERRTTTRPRRFYAKITLDPNGRFPDHDASDNVWPRSAAPARPSGGN